MSGRAPKWWRWFWAKLRGYFWLPCSLCGEPFGGQELNGMVPLGHGRSQLVCVVCACERQQIADGAMEDGRYPVRSSNGRTTHDFPFRVGS